MLPVFLFLCLYITRRQFVDSTLQYLKVDDVLHNTPYESLCVLKDTHFVAHFYTLNSSIRLLLTLLALKYNKGDVETELYKHVQCFSEYRNMEKHM